MSTKRNTCTTESSKRINSHIHTHVLYVYMYEVVKLSQLTTRTLNLLSTVFFFALPNFALDACALSDIKLEINSSPLVCSISAISEGTLSWTTQQTTLSLLVFLWIECGFREILMRSEHWAHLVFLQKVITEVSHRFRVVAHNEARLFNTALEIDVGCQRVDESLR